MHALIEKAVANQLAAISCPDSRFYSYLLSRDDSSVVLAGTLTLLGLIIGFSFAMATNRNDLRRAASRPRRTEGQNDD